MQLTEWLENVDNNLQALPKEILNNLSSFLRDQLDNCLKKAANNIDMNTKVRIALTGAFSSGKSSFINALFDRDLAAVNTNPTTRCRTDYVYGEKFKISDKKSGVELTLDQYFQNSTIEHALGESHYIVELPDHRLKDIVLMDTPGFDPPKSESTNNFLQDVEISKRAAEDADIVFFLFEADNGTLRKDVLEYLKELNQRTAEESENPLRIILIMNKADMKSENALNRIRDDVLELCRIEGIRVAELICHVSKPLKKRPEYFRKCQENILHLFQSAQADKAAIIGARRSVWAKINRQELCDLRDNLINFVEYSSKSLEQKYEKFNKKNISEYETKVNVITGEMKNLCLEFCKAHKYKYSYSHTIGGGIFFQDWKVYIQDDHEKLRPTQEEYNYFTEKLISFFNDMKLAGANTYATRLANTIYLFILEVFNERNDGV